ncbi:MAG: helix-turn-helix transcriptional regulator [Inhella sp.]
MLAVFPVSRSTWYQGVKEGRYPKPIRLSERRVAWPEPVIAALQRSRAIC